MTAPSGANTGVLFNPPPTASIRLASPDARSSTKIWQQPRAPTTEYAMCVPFGCQLGDITPESSPTGVGNAPSLSTTYMRPFLSPCTYATRVAEIPWAPVTHASSSSDTLCTDMRHSREFGEP